MKNILSYLLLITLFCGCTQKTDTEKYQKSRNNIVNVRDKVREIEIEDVLIGRTSLPYRRQIPDHNRL